MLPVNSLKLLPHWHLLGECHALLAVSCAQRTLSEVKCKCYENWYFLTFRSSHSIEYSILRMTVLLVYLIIDCSPRVWRAEAKDYHIKRTRDPVFFGNLVKQLLWKEPGRVRAFIELLRFFLALRSHSRA